MLVALLAVLPAVRAEEVELHTLPPERPARGELLGIEETNGVLYYRLRTAAGERRVPERAVLSVAPVGAAPAASAAPGPPTERGEFVAREAAGWERLMRAPETLELFLALQADEEQGGDTANVTAREHQDAGRRAERAFTAELRAPAADRAPDAALLAAARRSYEDAIRFDAAGFTAPQLGLVRLDLLVGGIGAAEARLAAVLMRRPDDLFAWRHKLLWALADGREPLAANLRMQIAALERAALDRADAARTLQRAAQVRTEARDIDRYFPLFENAEWIYRRRVRGQWEDVVDLIRVERVTRTGDEVRAQVVRETRPIQAMRRAFVLSMDRYELRVAAAGVFRTSPVRPEELVLVRPLELGATYPQTEDEARRARLFLPGDTRVDRTWTIEGDAADVTLQRYGQETPVVLSNCLVVLETHVQVRRSAAAATDAPGAASGPASGADSGIGAAGPGVDLRRDEVRTYLRSYYAEGFGLVRKDVFVQPSDLEPLSRYELIDWQLPPAEPR